jgi:hypothetical protein
VRQLWGLVLALALVALPTSSALARVAVIGTTAPLTDDSEQGMQTAAVLEALRLALQGAKAMGLSHVTVQYVTLLDAETVGARRERYGAGGRRPQGAGEPGLVGVGAAGSRPMVRGRPASRGES